MVKKRYFIIFVLVLLLSIAATYFHLNKKLESDELRIREAVTTMIHNVIDDDTHEDILFMTKMASLSEENQKTVYNHLTSKTTFSISSVDESSNSAILSVRSKDVLLIISKQETVDAYEEFMKSNAVDSASQSIYEKNIYNFISSTINNSDEEFFTYEIEVFLTYDESTDSYKYSREEYEKLTSVRIFEYSDDALFNISKKYENNQYIHISIDSEEREDYSMEITGVEKPRSQKYNDKMAIDNINNGFFIDIKYLDFPASNATTRTCPKSPLLLGETGRYDGTGSYFDDFDINILVDNIYTGDAASSILKENGEIYDKNKSYILIELSTYVNELTDKDSTFKLFFTDFDLLDSGKQSASLLYLDTLNAFDYIKAGESSTGYIAFEIDSDSKYVLSYRGFTANPLYFEIY